MRLRARRPRRVAKPAGKAALPAGGPGEDAASAFWGFGTALPEHAISAETSRAALAGIWPRLRATGVTQEVTRYTVEPFQRVLQRRGLSDAMARYAEHAPRLARLASCRALEVAGVRPQDVDLVISVSCTGYMVPSLDVHLAAEIGLRPDVIRLPITELGCSGGGAAIAAAHRHLIAFPSHRVLVIAVELTSLTFQRDDRSLDNLTASMVFGDGAAAAVMGAPRPAQLEIRETASWLLPASLRTLGFDLRDSGFHVVLDRRLPRVVEAGLAPIVAAFRARHGLREIDFYAVHAGGPRIFDAVESALKLTPDQLAVSRGVFRGVGNLSSASLLFCLAALPPEPGEGLSIAFGPGVSVELAHLRRC